jgi:hypothetical protein
MTIGGGLSGRVRLMPSPTAASPLPRARGLDRPAVQPPVPGVPIALCGARPNVMLSGACGHRAAAGSHGAGPPGLAAGPRTVSAAPARDARRIRVAAHQVSHAGHAPPDPAWQTGSGERDRPPAAAIRRKRWLSPADRVAQ